MRWHAVFAMMLAAASGCVAAGDLPRRAEEVGARITQVGAKAFLDGLSEDQLDELYGRIESGASAWVALAPRIAQGADAANAEGLTIELAFALPKNPEAVLSVATLHDDVMLGVDRVCGMPFIEDTVKDRPAYKRKATTAVRAVSDPDLQTIKQACLSALGKAD
ncbi:hypothetical protein ASG87_01215 [Frateuria sp. Soil773]|uniref:hypothetical protein n=1 Tax=Frateuria sp. Soil773 TaxID=1736407 RepID=UPI0006F70A49|nr:hypothetical protein [Frateuria sp. Soil773]KRE90783.1 hypothetical protein ASG87_01215 [Frateuria sp. Soil773]